MRDLMPETKGQQHIVSRETNNPFMPRSLDDAYKLADLLATSNLIPDAYKNNPGDIMVAMQWGYELGLKPLQALQNIAVINGRPSLWGDSVLALARTAPDFEYVNEYPSEDGNKWTCEAKRKNQPVVSRSYTIEQASQAGLLDKKGYVWQRHTQRMLQLRARGYALRDCFTDVLQGIVIREVAEDDQRKDFSDLKPQLDAAKADKPKGVNGLKSAVNRRQPIESKPVSGSLSDELLEESITAIKECNTVQDAVSIMNDAVKNASSEQVKLLNAAFHELKEGLK